MKVLILYEGNNYGGDFGLSFADGFRAHGCEVELLNRAETWHKPFDLVLAYGPFQQNTSMLPVARQLLKQPHDRRPVFAWWLTEGVPSLWMPGWFVEVASRLRLAFDRVFLTSSRGGLWSRGHRLRIFGELCWLHSHGVLDVLAVTSALRATYLQRHGLAPIVVPLGYHPVFYGVDQGLERDIDVCFIGNIGSARRRRLLEKVKGDLDARGIRVSVQVNLYDDERTHFLNRTKIMLNILRAPQDFVGQRFLLGAANKTLVVSEPMKDSQPFEAGRHLVITPIDEFAETVAYYLSHEAERRTLVDEAYRFVTQELTITQMTGRILEHARERYASRAARVDTSKEDK